jgi:galactokinase
MDQFASMMGREGCVMQLDCRSLEHKHIPIDFDEYQIVLFDTQVKHNLADSEYNIRRAQCEQAIEAIQRNNPQVLALRDVNLAQLNAVKDNLEASVYKRATYVIEENNRVELAGKLLQEKKIKEVGRLMYATHFGLSQLYEVSCKELDFLVDAASELDAVIGARMMGGGFGGCTINLVKKSAVNQVISTIEEQYYSVMDKKLKVYRVTISDGVKLIS